MRGRIVCSKAGRDKDDFAVVVGSEGNFLLICDGKQRPLERPKRKNIKHLAFTGTYFEEDSFKTNKQLRKSLAIYRNRAKFEEEA
ncbi:MAG: KOW domain-containing RNA-binding protein [Clostridia bacterium]|nr:KOW domain-containing RNA-binding protein [Clostridia bacterium]